MNLNFPDFSFQIKSEKTKKLIFDQVRKKYIVLTPEEWVRQNLISYLLTLNYPLALMSIEKSLPRSLKRYDAVIYNQFGEPMIIIECKAPDVTIDDKTLKQVASYLQLLNVPYVFITNGIHHFYIERHEDEIKMYPQIPHFSELRT